MKPARDESSVAYEAGAATRVKLLSTMMTEEGFSLLMPADRISLSKLSPPALTAVTLKL